MQSGRVAHQPGSDDDPTPSGSDLADERGFIETGPVQHADDHGFDHRIAFTNLPGVHVHVRSLGGSKREYVRSDGAVVATRRIRWRKNPLYPNPQVTVGGRVFEERLLGKRRNNHMRSPREVVELATGERLFRIDGLNFNGRAGAVIEFPQSRRYTFPVEGTGQPYTAGLTTRESGELSGDVSPGRRGAGGPSLRGTAPSRGRGDCHCSGSTDHGRTSRDDGHRITIPRFLLPATWRMRSNRHRRMSPRTRGRPGRKLCTIRACPGG